MKIITGTLVGAQALLVEMTRRVPPDGERRHNLTIEGQMLVLSLAISGRWQTVCISGESLVKPAAVVADEITELVLARLRSDLKTSRGHISRGLDNTADDKE